MRRKLATILVMLTLGLGYCKPPQPECSKWPQNPAQCRGVIPPRVPGR
jgi:hypothetical protein